MHTILWVLWNVPQNDAAGSSGLGPPDENELVVTDSLLRDLVCLAQQRGIERLLALQIRQGGSQSR